MGSCCENNCAIEKLRERQSGTLKVVLWVNALMFFVIAGASLYGKSTALLTDSLDNLGDALTYGLSLHAVSQGSTAKARVALFKGGLILVGACVVVWQIIQKLHVPVLPSYEIMSIFSILGLAANSLCLFLLWKHRNEDINMSSVWECSRNDIASNTSVLIAAGAVWFFASGWADIIVASCLVILLLRSSFNVVSAAIMELKST
ncbi:MAG TPA: cation transporter [Lentisphaeria bacterium]|nr:MAG: cation transporter [Lentisphaerae bacterium GWF2_50_93]HCE46738.1 cation transporter [Lentisphaeria bacterium]